MLAAYLIYLHPSQARWHYVLLILAGIRGHCPHGLKCWLYFPEDNCNFYRTTVFSHYAKKNCPAGGWLLVTMLSGMWCSKLRMRIGLHARSLVRQVPLVRITAS